MKARQDAVVLATIWTIIGLLSSKYNLRLHQIDDLLNGLEFSKVARPSRLDLHGIVDDHQIKVYVEFNQLDLFRYPMSRS